MTLFDILSMDERVIVLSDAGEHIIFTWNKSLTLQAWGLVFDRIRGSYVDDCWEELECHTLSTEPKTYESARKAAIEWSNS
jgi:hypothetical protein